MSVANSLLDQLALLSQDDLKGAIVDAIGLIKDPGKGIGTELFESLFKLVPQPCVEAVVVDSIEDPTKVLITRRSDNDPTYPGRWHCPGTFIRRGESNADALLRCVKRELGTMIKRYKFSGVAYNNPLGCDKTEGSGEKDLRHTIGLVHLVELDVDPSNDASRRWIDFNPCNILEIHQVFLQAVLGWEKTDRRVE